MPAPQPQATVIAIHSASTAAMITPRPDTTLGSLSLTGAFRQSNRKRSKRREKAMPTRLSLQIVDAGLPPEVAGRVAECGKYDASVRCSAELPGDDVIDELCLAGTQRRPAVAIDDEGGEGCGRELLLQLRPVNAP